MYFSLHKQCNELFKQFNQLLNQLKQLLSLKQLFIIIIDRFTVSVAQFLQYELCFIKAALVRLRAEQFEPLRTLEDQQRSLRTCEDGSVVSPSDS